MAIEYLRTKDGKTIGIIEQGTFKRRFRASLHLLRRYNALAIDACVYDANRGKFTELEFYDLDSGKIYRCSAQVFDRRKFEIQFGQHGRQYALNLRYWQVIDPNAEPEEQLALAL